MLTRCPRCKTSFRVLAEHLKLAHGRVQCGRCYMQFDALETLYDEEPEAVPRLDETQESDNQQAAGQEAVPEQAEAPMSVTEAPVSAPSSDEEDITDVPAFAEVESPPETPVPEAEPPAETADSGADIRLDTDDEKDAEKITREIPIGDLDVFEAETEDIAPARPAKREPATPREITIDEDDVLLQDFAEPVISRDHVDETLIAGQAQPVEERRNHPLWGIAAALLLLLGAVQFVWYQRENLVSRVPALRPAIEAVCAHLGCELKPRRDLEAIKVLARDVRDHPRFKDSLLVNATLENEAAFTQPYPILELTLYDAAGKRIGVRRFQPDEYLDSSVPVAKGMKPQQPVYIVLEIARPAEEAVSFEFKFY